MRRKTLTTSQSTIARALDMVGDWWTLLIINEALAGTRRFSDFQRQLNIPKNMLSARLRSMVAAELLKVTDGANGSPHHEYEPTKRGVALSAVLVALAQWSSDHLFLPGEARQLPVDLQRLRPLQKLQLRSDDGRLLAPNEIAMRPHDGQD